MKALVKKMFLRGLFLFPHNNIFEFHHVSADPEIDLSPRKMDTKSFYSFVESHGPYVALDEILEKKKKRYGAITFDDGLEDVYTIAYPFLKERKIPFTIFVLSRKLDQPGYITREQLAEMHADPLVTIGSHGLDHIRLGQADRQTQEDELKLSKRELEEILGDGYVCSRFAYPFGSYNADTLNLIENTGYAYGYAVKGRPLLPWNGKKMYEIPRLSIEDGTLGFYQKA